MKKQLLLSCLFAMSFGLHHSCKAAVPDQSGDKADVTEKVTSDDKNSPISALNQKNLFEGDFGKLPTDITSESLTLRSDDRVFIYKGHVKVVQGNMTLTSQTLEGTYNEDNQIEKMVARGDVVITKADMKATSQQALYDAKTATVTLLESPKLEQTKNILTADRIKIFLNEDRSQAEGQVRVTLVNKNEGPEIVPAAGTAAPKAENTKAPEAAKPAEKAR